ncbi:hypothetical protein GTA08_BOTSDO12565 [Neofusicoccum parvum]|uniref:Uncharacterized protein n=1 Tax=Neofusicoccum parvum TaxID=310453 RepID=A0ACB5SDV4_9PEZI|nr:hypothetical protein GTA08_BOTSDO12565 [Neofusicoccum parvum]
MDRHKMNEAEFSAYALTNLFRSEPRRPQNAIQLGHYNCSWDVRPDCAYWISLLAFQQGFRTKVPYHITVIQKRAMCPYFTVEFKKDSEAGIATACNQVAMASCIALYNRWKLRRTRVSKWTAEHRCPLRYYGLTFSNSQWEVWCTTPKAFDQWAGCYMRAVRRGDATVPADVACKDDIYALTVQDDELDQADISLLHMDRP